MKKICMLLSFSGASMLPVFAEAAAQSASSGGSYKGMALLAGALVVGFAAGLCGLGQGLAAGKAVEGIARQPEATKNIQANLILALAFIESLTLICFVVSMIIIRA